MQEKLSDLILATNAGDKRAQEKLFSNHENTVEAIVYGLRRGAGLAKDFWTDDDCLIYCGSDRIKYHISAFENVISTWKDEGVCYEPFWYLDKIYEKCAYLNTPYINWDSVIILTDGCADIYLGKPTLEQRAFRKKYKFLHQEIEQLIKKRKIKKPLATSIEQTPSQLGAKGAVVSNARHNKPKELAKKFAKQCWQENPDATKQDVAEKTHVYFVEQKIRNNDDYYSIGTLIDWTKSEIPLTRASGGRPKKPK